MKVGFAGLLGLLFICLKLTGHIAWSWAWVLLPIWLPLALALGLMLFALVMALATGQVQIGGRRNKQVRR